jgi:hypothetical protein
MVCDLTAPRNGSLNGMNGNMRQIEVFGPKGPRGLVTWVLAGVILAGCGPEDDCEEMCDRAAHTECGGFNIDSCVSSCRSEKAACSAQGAAFGTYIECLIHADFQCGGWTSQPMARTCAQEALPLYTCILEAP